MEKELIQEGMKKYVRIPGSGEETVSDRMFLYQNIPGFLPMEITRIDGQKQYIYDLSGMIPLESYLSGANMEQVKNILIQIFSLPECLGEYLLDENGVVMNASDLYINSGTETVYAIYHPESSDYGMASIVRLLEFIMNHTNQQDSNLMFLVYDIHQKALEGGTTTQQLISYIEDFHGAERKKENKPKRERQEVVRANVSRKEKNVQWKEYILSFIFLFLGMAIPVVIWYCGVFQLPVSGDTDWNMAVGAGIFFLGTAGYGAWKVWPMKKRNDMQWEKEGRKTACLIPCRGSELPIPLSYYPFCVGADKEQADAILTAGGVSRVHARFLKDGETVFVMDEESDSGTYYNEERLVPWEKKSVRDGDVLRFGQGEYVVEITERPCVG